MPLYRGAAREKNGTGTGHEERADGNCTGAGSLPCGKGLEGKFLALS